MATAPTETMLAVLNARVVTIEEANQNGIGIALDCKHRLKDKLNISQLTDFNIYARHFRLTTTTTADAATPPTWTRKRALADMSGKGELGSSTIDITSLGSGDISTSTHRALLEYNPTLI